MTTFNVMWTALAGVLHVAAWTGLSVGAVVGLAAAAYFLLPVRKLACIGIAAVVLGYACLMYGYGEGKRDEKNLWNAANLAAAQAAKERDVKADETIGTKYDSSIAYLNEMIAYWNKGAEDYAKADNSDCVLGADALRLRGAKTTK